MSKNKGLEHGPKQKEQMRDTNQIPKIVVQSPGVEMPILRSSSSQNSMPKPSMSDESFPPPPNPAEQAKLSLKPVSKRQEGLDEDQGAADGNRFEDMDTTRTPSRLTFNEKVKKFRAISMDLDPGEFSNWYYPYNNLHQSDKRLVLGQPIISRVQNINF